MLNAPLFGLGETGCVLTRRVLLWTDLVSRSPETPEVGRAADSLGLPWLRLGVLFFEILLARFDAVETSGDAFGEFGALFGGLHHLGGRLIAGRDGGNA